MPQRWPIIIYVALLSAFFLLFPGLAGGASGDETPEVQIKPPSSHTARKILIFPLDIPSYVIRGVTWPLGAGLSELEKHGIIDKTLDLLSNDEKTFWVYPIIEGGAGTGFGGGLGLKHKNLFHRGYVIGATYRIHINLDHRGTFQFGKPRAFEIFGKPASYVFDSDWSRTTAYDYYGIGDSTQRSNHAAFGLDDIVMTAALPYEPIEHLNIRPFFGGNLGQTMSRKSGSNPKVQDIFTPDQIGGFGQWLDYIHFGLQIAHDTRDFREEPQSGGIRRLAFRRFQCLNDNGFNYNQYEADVRQYLRLLKTRQILVLNMGWIFKQPTGGGVVPFFKLAGLDSSAPLRGFPRGRWRDKNSAIFNIEYRFPLWDMLGGEIFFDTGRVFNSISNFSFNGFKYSLGGGTNLRIPEIALFRFEMAYGGEGLNTMFGISRSL